MDRFAVVGLAMAGVAGAASAQFAEDAVDYVPGVGVVSQFADPNSAVGMPARFTGETAGFPAVTSPFSPAFEGDELVQIGAGGSLTLRLDTPARDRASNPFGVDLLIFGNGGLIDEDFPSGQAGSPAGFFGLDEMLVAVSDDGSNFVDLGAFTEGLFPTMGYNDSGPFDSTPGASPTSFTTPMDPAITAADFDGLDFASIRALYAGSGGGTPIDLAGSGLAAVRYVRISNPIGSGVTVEIDAVSVVPTPGSLALLGAAFCAAQRRRVRRIR